MRDLTSIEALIPVLDARLAVMYSGLISESRNSISVDKQPYFLAESYVFAMKKLIACDPDIVMLNKLLNDFLSAVHNCKDPVLGNPDILELFCDSDAQLQTFWVPDDVECESGGTTTTTLSGLFQFFATITSFDTPDDGGIHALISSYEVTLLQETGANKQFIEIPSAFFDFKTLSSILYWSDIYSSYVDVNKLSEWVVNDVTIDDIAYKQILYQGPKRGYTTVKFIFT